MSVEATRQVVEGFLSDLGGHWLSHGVDFLDVAAPPPSVGRPAAVLAIGRFFGGGPFHSPRREDLSLIVVDGRAAAEWTFHGRHVASLSGEDPTHRIVTTPMAATFDVTDGEIVRARLFYDAADLRRQLIPTDGEPEAVWETARPQRHLVEEQGRNEPDVERNEATGHDRKRTPAVAPTRSLGGSPPEVSREP